jgi:Ca-activated chloride channel family protein
MILKRLKNALTHKNTGILLFSGLSIITLFFVLSFQSQQPSFANVGTSIGKPVTSETATASGVKVTTTLVRDKFVVGDTGEVEMKVEIDSPNIKAVSSSHSSTDFIIVLDRSGSMSGDKIEYAKKAIHNIVDRLQDGDAFSLIGFDDSSAKYIPLTKFSTSLRDTFNSKVDSLYPGGGTNMGAGLEMALEEANLGHSAKKKIVLLSDGQANVGISDPTGLAAIARRVSGKEVVLSTIGLGLDFNEVVLSSLADNGMGDYAFLESPTQLETLLNKFLNESRALYAAGSELNLNLSDGVSIKDAGGYPIETSNGVTKIITGSLAGNQKKSFMLTFNISTNTVRELPVATMNLIIKRDGKEEKLTVLDKPLVVAILAPEKRHEAISSINQPLYRESFLGSKLGQVKQKMNSYMLKRDYQGSQNALNEYKALVEDAEKRDGQKVAGVAMPAMEELASKNALAAGSKDESFRKKISKELQAEARSDQRSFINK